MPPRKRRTKLTTRAKPKLPQGQDDDMDRTERLNKMELLLRDFDLEVNNRLEQMQREAHKMRSMINTLFRLEMCKMNKDILRMTRKELLAKGGRLNDTALQEVSQYVDSLSEHITKPLQNSGSSAPKSDQSDSITPPPPTKKKTRQRKATTNKKKTKTSSEHSATEEDENVMPPPTQSVRRSTRKPTSTLVTPAQQTRKKRGLSNTCWNTPAVTPKFDPRLPVTPGARRARKGERLMSMTGSPVIPAAANSRHDVLPKDLKENIIAVNNHFQHIDIQDQVARMNIQMLQDSLAKILHTLPAT